MKEIELKKLNEYGEVEILQVAPASISNSLIDKIDDHDDKIFDVTLKIEELRKDMIAYLKGLDSEIEELKNGL